MHKLSQSHLPVRPVRRSVAPRSHPAIKLPTTASSPGPPNAPEQAAEAPRQLCQASTTARRPEACFRRPASPCSAHLVDSGSTGMATIQRLVSEQQQCVFGAGASLHMSAITQEQMRAQVRPLSASCGSLEVAGFQALGRRSRRWTPEQPRRQPKTTDHRHNLPRHDPGHRVGGAAPKGPPQAEIDARALRCSPALP